MPLILAVLLLCSGAAAIPVLEGGLPPDLPENATVEIGEDIQEVETLPVQTGDFAIERIHPGTTTPGSEITISLKVTNRGTKSAEVRVYEDLRPGLKYPDTYEIGYHVYEALRIPYYTWTLSLGPGASKTLTYRAVPEAVGMVAFPSAIVTDAYGNRAESAATYLRVECSPNGVCDPGENTLFCPEDCPSGSADDLCDGIRDDRIDPDCQAGYDPDAGPATTIPPTTEAPVGIGVVLLAIMGVALLFARKRN
jgi:hypothetical protein